MCCLKNHKIHTIIDVILKRDKYNTLFLFDKKKLPALFIGTKVPSQILELFVHLRK